ncbi:putative GTPase-activating protein skywalker [Encephalitozoon cuniculi]|nr:putative GTPase-activating protein skywalker [Encephalitozoon cuniculi]
MGIGNCKDYLFDSSLPDLPELQFDLMHDGKKYKASILPEKIVTRLRESLQDRYKYSTSWRLLFSTFENGFSYRTFLESFGENEWPFVLACRTKDGDLFGAFFEDRIRIARNPYGRDSMFLFTAARRGADRLADSEVAVFRISKSKGTGIYCCPDFFAFGCSGERFGLLINKSLLDGETHPVETFGNCLLASKRHFRISYLELWLVQI